MHCEKAHIQLWERLTSPKKRVFLRMIMSKTILLCYFQNIKQNTELWNEIKVEMTWWRCLHTNLSHSGSNKLKTYNPFAFKTLFVIVHPSLFAIHHKRGGKPNNVLELFKKWTQLYSAKRLHYPEVTAEGGGDPTAVFIVLYETFIILLYRENLN